MYKSSIISIGVIFLVLLTRNISALQAQETMNINHCIKTALQNNTAVISDKLERQDAWKRLKLQLRLFFPELAVTFAKSDSVTVNAADSRINTLGFSLNQVIFNGGRSLSNYRSAERELKLRDLKAVDLLDQLSYKICLGYIDILKYRKILDVQIQSLENLQEQITIADLEYRLGSITESDLLDIKMQAVQYSLTVKESEEKLFQSRFSLSELMNISVLTMPELEGSLNLEYRGIYTNQIINDSLFTGQLAKEAEEFNKELMSCNMSLLNAERDLLDSRIIWIPKIEASADFSITGVDYPLNESSFSLGLNFSFDTPLFPGSLSMNAGKAAPDEHNTSLSSEISAIDKLEGLIASSLARNEIHRTKLKTETLKRQISYRVEALTRSIVLNSQRCSISRNKLVLETEKLKIEKTRVEIGELTRLDYVKSEINHSNHKTELIENIAKLYSSEIELEMSCGISGRQKDFLINNEVRE